MAEPQDDGWENVTDPTEIQKVLGKNGANKVLGLTAGGPGSGGGKAASEGERKAAFLATRVAGNIATLNGIDKDDQRPGLFQAFVGGVLGDTARNYVTGTERQRAEGAQTDLLDAALTLGTGAAYTKEQLDGYRRSYFPQLGDSEKAVADKRERLKLLLQSARVGAGSAAPQIDAALKAAGYPVSAVSADPGEQAKGGDPQSGTAGAAIGGSDQPPAGPGAPDNGDRTVGGFADELPAQTANQVKLTDVQRSAFAALARRGGSADELGSLLQSFGVNAANPADLAKLADALKKNPNLEFAVADPSAEVKPVDAGDGVAGAAARGAGNALTLGFLDEVGALGDVVSQGGTYAQNLDRRRGQELFDEQNHGLARFGGQIVGSLPLGGVDFAGARAASRAAGVSAMRAGLGQEVARMQAARAFATRSALEGAGMGGIYGAGESNGDLGDRAIGAAAGAAFGGATAGALSYGGGRLLARAGGGPTIPPSAGQETLAAMERQGVTPFPADVGGSITRRATGAVAQTLGGVAPIRRAAQETLDTAQAVRDRVASSLGVATNPEAAGETARAGAEQYIRSTGQRIGRIYDVAEAAGGQARVDTPEALRVLNQEIAPLEESPVASPGLAVLQGLRDSLQQPNTIRGLRNMRTAVRDQFEATGLRGSNIQRVADRVVNAATDDIVNGLRSQGLDRAANAYRRADRLWSERLRVIDDELEPILGKNTEKSGEQVVDALKSAMRGNNRRFVGFLDALPSNEEGIVRASLVQRLGQATKGQQDETGEAFSLNTFLSNWSEIGETAKNRLLGAQGRAALNDLARIASSAREAQRFANASNTGAAVSTSALGAATLAGPVGIAAAGKALAASYAAGRLLASPRFARWLARPPRSTSPAASTAWVERLTRIAKAEPSIAQDVLGIQAGLRRLTQGTSLPAAAQESSQAPAVIDGQASQQQPQPEGAQP